MNEKPYDLVAFGAASFVGKLLCRYLTHEFGFDGRLKWAAAGRSQSKLEALRSSLGEAAAALPIEIARAESGSSRPSAHTRFMASLWSRFVLQPAPITAT